MGDEAHPQDFCHPPGKSSASLGRFDWEALGDQWHDMASRKSHKGCTMKCWVPDLAYLTVFGKGWRIVN